MCLNQKYWIKIEDLGDPIEGWRKNGVFGFRDSHRVKCFFTFYHYMNICTVLYGYTVVCENYCMNDQHCVDIQYFVKTTV
jgi:hypothetical protein